LFSLTSKQDSPQLNPAIQYGSLISVISIFGLFSGIIFGKASINTFVKPLFIDALILNIFFNPLAVRCSPLIIKSIAALNKIKSLPENGALFFFVNRGYLRKWV
jgi:hypothetical protein